MQVDQRVCASAGSVLENANWPTKGVKENEESW